MLPKDYLLIVWAAPSAQMYLTLQVAFLLDVKNRCWSKEMMEICGERDSFRRFMRVWEVVGTLKPEVAKELGF